MPDDQPDPTAAAARVAAALHQTGSVMVFRAFDGRMAAVAGGRAGYGPDREAALRDLARQVESDRTAPGVDSSADHPGSLGGTSG